jgi:cytochrome c553
MARDRSPSRLPRLIPNRDIGMEKHMKTFTFLPLAVALAVGVAVLLGATPVDDVPMDITSHSEPLDTKASTSSDEAPTKIDKIKKKCGVCHNAKTGYCGKKKTPAIAGLSKAKVLKSLNNPPKAMKAVAKGMDAAEKATIAAWVASLDKCAPAAE